jgi:carbamoyltransferase
MKFAGSSLNDAQEKFKNYTTAITVDIQSTHGIVKTYESATTLIKQHPLENGKVMGLSSYGKYNKEYDSLFINENIGNYKKLSTENIDNFHASTNSSIQCYSKKEITEENYKFYADYSYAVQIQSQEAALKLIKKWIEITGITDVCVTGGYGLNVVANRFYQQHLSNVNFYFEPLADDTGNSIGGAMLYYRSKTKNSNVADLKNTFFHGIEYQLDKVKGEQVDLEQVVNLLIQQKTLAIYYKQAEAGPRALGHRSIIFDARNKDAKRIVNKIKKREWYRPFAAVMLK